MKKQFAALLLLYGFWIVMFMIQKPLFMLFNPVENSSPSDWFNVMIHGFKLDFCFAAYFLFLPVVMFIVRVFVQYNIKKVLRVYNLVLAVVVALVFSVDCVLYSYWEFRIDATLIFYLKDFNESLNSVGVKDVFKFLLIFVPYLAIVVLSYRFMVKKLTFETENSQLGGKTLKKILITSLFVLCLPVLVVCTRGGLSTATANVGMVYYCNNQKLNLAAINPAFNLVYSLTKNEDFAKKFRFYDDDFAKQEFDKLLSHKDCQVPSFLSEQRPNIVVVILESFSGRLIGAVNGALAQWEGKEVTPNCNALAEQSMVFENAYSNGMRTDRGIVSILSGFPAQPDMTIIKYPEKTATLPSMAKTLGKAGYYTEMLYGGDVNFANMRSYFYGSLYNNVIDFKYFPAKQRLSKWGVSDEVMFSFLAERMKKYDKSKPYFTTFLTLSSHEPFDVSMHKFKDAYVNSIAYTDSCIGGFVNELKTSGLWENTLVVFVADHASKLPQNALPTEADFYHIPVLFTGGVIKQPERISTLMNQTDIAKTLFSAMNLPCEEYIYSRNVFNPTYQHYALFVYTTGFGFITPEGTTVWDKDAGKAIYGADKDREMKGKVFLQTLYNDISKR